MHRIQYHKYDMLKIHHTFKHTFLPLGRTINGPDYFHRQQVFAHYAGPHAKELVRSKNRANLERVVPEIDNITVDTRSF